MADSVVNGCLMVENWSSLGAAADDLVGHFGFLNSTFQKMFFNGKNIFEDMRLEMSELDSRRILKQKTKPGL